MSVAVPTIFLGFAGAGVFEDGLAGAQPDPIPAGGAQAEVALDDIALEAGG